MFNLGLLSLHAFSQILNENSTDQAKIERIIVTAQKRVQSLKDVPLSVSVMSGEHIDKYAIANLEELSLSVPNLTINESGIGTNLFIRGVGSGVNIGFEQAVGTYIDGVYFGRARSARSTLFDIARVEVLKGPQDTLFGKNAIAGALNITTRQPNFDLEGYLELNTEPKFNGLGFKSAISIPINDELTTRLAMMQHNEDGWIKNDFINQPERQKDDLVIRSTWLWQPSEQLDLAVKAEYGKFETVGRVDLVSQLPQNLAVYEIVKNSFPSFNPSLSLTKFMGSNTPMGLENADNETALLSLNMNWIFLSGTLTSLSAYSNYDFTENADVDYLPIDFLHIASKQKQKQWSQELRFTSNNTGLGFNYIAGVYYQKNELTSIRNVDIDNRIVGNDFSGRRHNTFLQDATNKAVFAQVNYKFNAYWLLNTGLRYSYSKKALFKHLYIANFMSEEVNSDPVANFVFRNSFNMIPHQFSFESDRDGIPFDFNPIRRESHFSPSVNIQYFSNQNLMMYASIAEGFKGGGFDEDNTAGIPDKEEYEDEQVLAFELGVKSLLFDEISLNLSLFRSQYDDIQVSTFDGLSGFNVGNAAKSISQGVELDGRWIINKQWRVKYAFTYLDAYYESYLQGQCTSSKTHCDDLGVQDLSGRSLQFSPKFSGAINFQFEQEINNWLVIANGNLNYSDDFEIPGDLDPELLQKSFIKINARIQLGDLDENWYIALVGKNLTNKLTTSWGNDIPFAPGGYFQHIDAPRSIELMFNWRF
ncbi:Outer membrane receptor proteins, mostly Fe transport [Pseudoalteromonas denitrificans DSM 6059]|uniref:Outer membrane receptor proteins, mostly Fe transport n=2 Tax=Pseudoalteromonas TaxID=53246 RepID=A0A1I1RN85_9GAMM|nr:Outer membrane receptor proteins, mostly Fe transport [Pseudoalteromonas denitrificans DSM 6059]